MTLKSYLNFEEKLTFCLKNYMRNLVNVHASSGRSQNLHFDVPLLSVAYKGLAKRVQKILYEYHFHQNVFLDLFCVS